jgi:hypothetical protein
MDLNGFWAIVDEVHGEADGDMDEKCELLTERLEELTTEELQSFIDHFDARVAEAYSWDLWGAAYVIGGGCGDDSFSDFRSTLISCGRSAFERALQDPDSLADVELPDEPFYEGFGYVGFTVFEERVGKMPQHQGGHPREPSGQDWDEEDLPGRFPKLTAKFDGDANDDED